MRRAALLAAATALVALASPVLAEQQTRSCTVDVGAPFLLVDADDEGDDGPALGGCLLVHGADQAYRIDQTDLGNWVVTLYIHDCALQLDRDGDGGGFEPVGFGDRVPTGADLWAKCETGTDLANRVVLEPV